MSGKMALTAVKRITAILLLLVSGICASSLLMQLWLSTGDTSTLLLFSTLTAVTLLGGLLTWGWIHRNFVLGVYLIVFGIVHVIEKVLKWPGNVAPVVIPLVALIGIGVFLIYKRNKRIVGDKGQQQTLIAKGEPPSATANAAAKTCPNCGESYSPAQYRPDAEVWTCGKCAQPLPRI